MAYTNPSNPDCKNCNKSGLAILPVRYAVVPLGVEGSLPSPLGNKVIDVPLKHHKYAMRTLRAGYFYLFHEKHARGSHIKWEIYSVSAAGTLWKQPSPFAIKPCSSEPTCSRQGDNIPASVITIESPEKCKRVWIAFSEHIWSKETLNAFASDSKMRDRRMQTFLPATWIAAGGYRHGIVATQKNVEQIVEYHPSFNSTVWNGPDSVPRITKEDGGFSAKLVELQTTRYVAETRARQSNSVTKAMEKMGINGQSKPHPPMIMAVWDAIGITHELNGFRNQPIGWVERYNAEREQQIAAMMSIDEIKVALQKRPGDLVDKEQRLASKRGSAYWDTTKRRLQLAELPPAARANELEVCEIMDGWQRRQAPERLFKNRLIQANQQDEPYRSQEIEKLKAEVDKFLNERATFASTNVETARDKAWEKYEELLVGAPNSKKKLYQVFKENHDRFHTLVNKLADARTEDLLGWLNSKLLIDALTEFHGSDVVDGIVFDDHIGHAVAGINSSESGRVKLDAWINEIKATETNLVWRAMALNQSESINELNAYLQEVKRNANENTPANASVLFSYAQKSMKAIADLYKKVTSLHNGNNEASKGAPIFNNVRLEGRNFHKLDLLVVTAGDKLFKLFGLNNILDRQSEYLIQHLLSVRGLADPLDSFKLIQSQINHSVPARRIVSQQSLAYKQSVRSGIAPKIDPHAEAMKMGWKEFTRDAVKFPSAMRDARLAILIMFIEGVNVGKLYIDCIEKKDLKSMLSIVASGLTIASAYYDVAGIVAKNALKKVNGGESLSFQRIKLTGGLLSAGATSVTVFLDYSLANKARSEGNDKLWQIYIAKLGFGIVNLGVIGGTTFSYAAPLLLRMTGNTLLAASAEGLGARAGAIVAQRVFFMAVGSWLTLIGFGLQILIWVFDEDELQRWCRLCPFGVSSSVDKAFTSTKEQVAAMHKVLVSLGFIEDKSPKDYSKIYPTPEEMLNYD
jgi:hypothetical protein